MAVTPYIQWSHTSSTLSHFSSPSMSSSMKRTLSLNDVVSAPRSSFFRMTSSSKLRTSRSMPRISVLNSDHFSDDDDDKFAQQMKELSQTTSHPMDSAVDYIEMKANRLEIPFSIRMIKRKRQRSFEEELRYHGEDETAFFPVKTAFDSMLFIIRELQSHYASGLHAILCNRVTETVAKLQYEMVTSFVWLFQQVYSHTPSLMVYVMVLLANFTVYSVMESSTVEDVDTWENEDRTIVQSGDEEDAVWESMVKEASRMKREVRCETLDDETVKRFVSPVRVEIETDVEYEEYFRTELLYQTWLKQDSYNVMLLVNYAQFLYLIVRDFDRAEEYFKRAIKIEPKDAIALERYAYFLWYVRKDLWAAEEIFLEAIATDPNNQVHLSDYAHFLWQTGNDDTCFPDHDHSFQIDSQA